MSSSTACGGAGRDASGVLPGYAAAKATRTASEGSLARRSSLSPSRSSVLSPVT